MNREYPKRGKSTLAITSLMLSALAFVSLFGWFVLPLIENSLPSWVKSWILVEASQMRIGPLVSLGMAFFGAILGTVALVRMNRSKGKLTGQIEAIFGLLIGVALFLFFGVIPFLVTILFMLDTTR